MKSALVTGGARGIGAAICVALAQRGYAVAINYNKSKEKAEKLAKVITESYEVPALPIQADVSDYSQVQKMVNTVNSDFGGIDVLVNNAGIAEQKLITEVTAEDWKNMMATNLDGMFYCAKEVLPHMISKKQGAIINISSIWGQVGASCEVAYSTSKAGIIGFTKALAKEVGPSNIRVNCVAPGVVMTDMMASFGEEDIQVLQDETPLQKLGTPKNIADAVAFLVSPQAEFITGQVLGVNGGFVI